MVLQLVSMFYYRLGLHKASNRASFGLLAMMSEDQVSKDLSFPLRELEQPQHKKRRMHGTKRIGGTWWRRKHPLWIEMEMVLSNSGRFRQLEVCGCIDEVMS